MSDLDLHSGAWHVPPGRYLADRPPEFDLPAAPASRYLAMRDGCRLAVDVWLPQQRGEGAPPAAAVPSIVVLTPYYRRFALRPGGKAEVAPNAAKFRDAFVPRGYAVVVVDVRGTGASFGTRDSFRSPREREDSREIADWIVAQPWSDGRVGATGISYPGAAADFLASTGHPAVRAIAPLFAVWDTWADHYYPGGILLSRLAQTYDDLKWQWTTTAATCSGTAAGAPDRPRAPPPRARAARGRAPLAAPRRRRAPPRGGSRQPRIPGQLRVGGGDVHRRLRCAGDGQAEADPGRVRPVRHQRGDGLPGPQSFGQQVPREAVGAGGEAGIV
jgi:predicted acyl esterase